MITGRVRDAVGEPITGMQVFLMKTEYTEDGRRRLTEAEGTITDDRGEYRLYWIPPGRYYLSAGQFLTEKKEGLGPDVIADQIFPITFYRSVADLQRAVPIDMHPGMEIGAMDIVFTQSATFGIRGIVVDSTTGRPPSTAEMFLSPRAPTDSVIVENRKNYTTSYDSTTGRFEIRGVVPGEYWLGAFAFLSKSDVFSQKADADATAGDLFDPSLRRVLRGKSR